MPVSVPLAREAITGVTPVPRATTHQHVHPQEGHTDDQSGANEPPRNEGLWGGLRSRQSIPGREPGAGGEGNLTTPSPPSLACEGRMGGSRRAQRRLNRSEMTHLHTGQSGVERVGTMRGVLGVPMCLQRDRRAGIEAADKDNSLRLSEVALPTMPCRSGGSHNTITA